MSRCIKTALVPLALSLLMLLSGCAKTEAEAIVTPEPTPVITPEPTPTPFTLPYFGTAVNEDAARVTVDQAVTAEELEEIFLAVELLPALTELNFTEDCVPLEKARAFRGAHPDITLGRKVSFFGTLVPDTGAALTLSEFPPIDTLITALSGFDTVESVDLNGSPYTEEELLRLRKAYPDMPLLYKVTLLGKEYPSDVMRIDLSKTKIKQPELDELYAKLGLFTRLKTLDMCECGPSDEEMDALNKAFPGTNVVWMIRLRGAKTWKIRTDATAFSTALGSNPKKQLWSRDVQPLIYCTDLMALDLGHNEVRELDFLHYLPKLEYLILAGCGISDISVLAELKELKYVELFANDIVDLSPLAELDNLVDLNIAKCEITDLSPLYGLKNLRRLWCSRNYFPEEQKAEIQAALPDCTIDFTAWSPTGNGWRKHENFYTMRKVFGLEIID